MSANSNLAMEYSMGVGGGRLVQDTSAYTGNFVALTFLAPTVISSISGGNIVGTFSTVTIPAGITIQAPITSFQLSSSVVWATNGVIQS
jgi:hypothetical protein